MHVCIYACMYDVGAGGGLSVLCLEGMGSSPGPPTEAAPGRKWGQMHLARCAGSLRCMEHAGGGRATPGLPETPLQILARRVPRLQAGPGTSSAGSEMCECRICQAAKERSGRICGSVGRTKKNVFSSIIQRLTQALVGRLGLRSALGSSAARRAGASPPESRRDLGQAAAANGGN